MKHLSERDLEIMYDDYLDEVYGVVTIGGHEYITSHVVKLVDPTAYRSGLVDWLDGELRARTIFEHADGEYYDEVEVIDDEEGE